MVVSYRLSVVTIALSLTIRPQFAVECLRSSNQQGVGLFGATVGEERVDWCKSNFKAISENRVGLSYARMQKKSCRYLPPFEHNARTWQTNRRRNGNMDCSTRNRLSATSPKIARKPCCRRETARCCCNFPRWRPAAIRDFIESEVAATPKNPTLEQNMKWIG